MNISRSISKIILRLMVINNKINLLECNKYQILGACKEFLNLINNNFKIKKNKTQNYGKFLYFLERYKMINRVKIDAYYMLAKQN